MCLLMLILVLIVPFMELKPVDCNHLRRESSSLNRTFYGIETRKRTGKGEADGSVLIVPFMELKLFLDRQHEIKSSS